MKLKYQKHFFAATDKSVTKEMFLSQTLDNSRMYLLKYLL